MPVEVVIDLKPKVEKLDVKDLHYLSYATVPTDHGEEEYGGFRNDIQEIAEAVMAKDEDYITIVDLSRDHQALMHGVSFLLL